MQAERGADTYRLPQNMGYARVVAYVCKCGGQSPFPSPTASVSVEEEREEIRIKSRRQAGSQPAEQPALKFPPLLARDRGIPILKGMKNQEDEPNDVSMCAEI